MTPTSVLLVDDSPAFLRVATQFLQGHAELLVVGQVLGGKEALAQAEALRPDVVLVDLAMPDLPGLALIPRLRAAQPEMGIIALTLLDADGYRQAALAAGADEFVAKATLGTDLLPAIRRVARARLVSRGQQGTRPFQRSPRTAHSRADSHPDWTNKWRRAERGALRDDGTTRREGE